MFITIEGVDGCGKTLQVQNISDFLFRHNVKHIITHEPGATHIGSQIRNILLNPENNILPLQEVLLFLADRVGHINEVVKPALNNNIVVLCDRYIDSTLALQHFGHNILSLIDFDILFGMFEIPMPDLTFFIDLDPEICYSRSKKRNKIINNLQSRIDDFNLDYHKRVYDGYCCLADSFPRIKKVDGRGTIDEVTTNILDILKTYEFNNIKS